LPVAKLLDLTVGEINYEIDDSDLPVDRFYSLKQVKLPHLKEKEKEKEREKERERKMIGVPQKSYSLRHYRPLNLSRQASKFLTDKVS
jgi:hypothetical protein